MSETTEIVKETAEEHQENFGRKLNPRQRKLVTLLVDVEQGKLTLTEAMLQAGYTETTARQQTNTLQNLRKNSVMQEALRKVGVTEELLADNLKAGIDQLPAGGQKLSYLQTSAELLDAFPAKKQINADVNISDLIKAQESPPSHGDSQP